jgi:hypothetical protein
MLMKKQKSTTKNKKKENYSPAIKKETIEDLGIISEVTEIEVTEGIEPNLITNTTTEVTGKTEVIEEEITETGHSIRETSPLKKKLRKSKRNFSRGQLLGRDLHSLTPSLRRL